MHCLVLTLINHYSIFSNKTSIKRFQTVCQQLTGLTTMMIKVAQYLHILNLDAASVYVKMNAKDKKLKAFCKKSGTNAALDSLLSTLKAGGIYSNDEDRNAMPE